jgi:dTMP kinase
MTQLAGQFIVIEGIDGVGKSTQAARLAERLRADGHAVTLTREPGGSEGAEAIRELLVSGDTHRWSAMTELLLFNAARRDHMEKTIRPALEGGGVVICDRFVDSTRCYQSAGRGAMRATVDALHNLAIALNPDLTLVLDLDPADAAARAKARAEAMDGDEGRFERFGLDFQRRLRAAFLELAEQDPRRYAVIDASGEADAIAERLWQATSPRMAAAS